MENGLGVARIRDPLIVITIFSCIAILSTALRLESRRIRQISLARDDCLMVGALVFLLLSIAIQLACVIVGGVGRHMEDVEPDAVVTLLKLILPMEVLYAMTMCFLKGSVISFYLRIFGDKSSFRISAYIVTAIVIMWAISVILEALFLCRPLAFNWDPAIPGGVCGDRNKAYITSGALNVVTDVMTIALPVPHILHLNLALRAKIGLLFMFTMGIFIIIISIIRIKSIEAVKFSDPTFTMALSIFWTNLEPCLCIINANLPMVRTIFVDLAPRTFGPAARSSSTGPEGNAWRGRGASLFELTGDERDLERGRSEGTTSSQKSNLTNISRGGDSTMGTTESGHGGLPSPAMAPICRPFAAALSHSRAP